MINTFRWYGETDPITLNQIKQIPLMKGIVTALHGHDVGTVWTKQEISNVKNSVEQSGMDWEVIESIPVHEDIKLGKNTRDKYIDAYCASIQNMGELGIPVLCYNFMPVFDWMRSDLALELSDGSNALAYDEEVVKNLDPGKMDYDRPAWDNKYTPEIVNDLIKSFQKMSEAQLFENLHYFLEKVIPVAEASNVLMAIHPDDQPWSIFGLPRIVTCEKNIDKLLKLVDSPSNGLTLCSGSLGANPENKIPKLIRKYGEMDRIHFAHIRNIKFTGKRCFHEVAHPSGCGNLDIFEIVKAYHDINFKGSFRPDHGRMIWNDKGLPGYGLYDRALGSTYISGLWEAIMKNQGQV